jgi:hypothetical protein
VDIAHGTKGIIDRIPDVVFSVEPAGWHEFWREHGTSWRSVIDLHFEICDRLRASSSPWRSS